ncbi:histone acetyltransferase KAT7-like [Oscarella lobularis]|uniref:histone acetyltransferase KAT7-like n=1 Tax=Oscarella lobularis TaxID=121494 RepID=UPI0033137106
MRLQRRCAEVALDRLTKLTRGRKRPREKEDRDENDREAADESIAIRLKQRDRKYGIETPKLVKKRPKTGENGKPLPRKSIGSSSSTSSIKSKNKKSNKRRQSTVAVASASTPDAGIARSTSTGFIPVEFCDLSVLDGHAPPDDVALFRSAQREARKILEEEQFIEAGHREGPCPKYIVLGEDEFETWYASPYPERFQCLNKIFVCEYCLSYFACSIAEARHMSKCKLRHPPGNEIYRKDDLSVFEVDGASATDYCRNLCLFAKLFLDHKTLHYEVEPFLFYIMTKWDSDGCHAVGYFSKEKESVLKYNLSCILTFPQYMRKGYGRLLIDFSYVLSRVEGKVGSPEKPLSDLGLLSYRSYWKDVVVDHLVNLKVSSLCIKDLSQASGIAQYDLISTLQSMNMIKYWKGQHIVLKNEELFRKHRTNYRKRSRQSLFIDPKRLDWPVA